MIRRLAASAAIITSLGITTASAEDLVFMLDNQSSFVVTEFYSSPRNVNEWEEDVLGSDVLEAGAAMRITIADGRDQCDYDMRIVFEDGDVLEDHADLCSTGSYTITD